MLIIGCDYHPSMQQIAWVDTETGLYGERRLTHRSEAEQFYRELKEKRVHVCVGMEATGTARWFAGASSFPCRCLCSQTNGQIPALVRLLAQLPPLRVCPQASETCLRLLLLSLE